MKEEGIVLLVKKGVIKFTKLLAYMRIAERDNLAGVVIKDKKSGKIILEIEKDYESNDRKDAK